MATDININATGDAGKSGAAMLRLAWMRIQSFRMGDAGTSARAHLRLRKSLGTTASGIRTSCVGGFVELRGTVPDRATFERAAEVARGALGARGVLNFLDIK